MAKNPEPVLLELATLPREQMGPFLMLGLEKDASKDDIEAHWAEQNDKGKNKTNGLQPTHSLLNPFRRQGKVRHDSTGFRAHSAHKFSREEFRGRTLGCSMTSYAMYARPLRRKSAMQPPFPKASFRDRLLPPAALASKLKTEN